MPQIKPYIAQVNVQGGLSSAQMSPEAAASTGRGISQIGQGVSNVADAAIKIEDTIQTSDAAAKMAELRVRQTNKIKEAAMNGDVNSDKFIEEYNNEFQDLSNQYSSNSARKYLNNANNELKSTIATSTFSAQAELSRVKILESKQVMMSKWTATLATDPTQRESILKESDEFINSMPLSAQMKEKMRYEDRKNLDVAEFEGRISLLGGQAKTEAAIKSLENLKASLKGGAFNEIRAFDNETISFLENKIEREISGRISKDSFDEAQRTKAKAKAADVELVNVFKKILDGDPTYFQDVKNSKNFSAEDIRSAINFAGSMPNKKATKITQHNLFIELADKARLPDGDKNKITTVRGLGYSEEELPLENRIKLTKIIQDQDSPEGKANASQERIFLNGIKSELTKKDKMQGNLLDPDGPAKYIDFEQEYYERKEKMRNAGENYKELYDFNSKNYFGNEWKKYKSSVREIIKKRKIDPNARPKTTDGKPLSASEILKKASGENK